MKYLFLSSLLLLLTSLTFSDESSFNEIILKQQDTLVKKRLVTFEQEGIELPLVWDINHETQAMSNDSSTFMNDVDSVAIERVISTAKSYLGTRHVMGGTSKTGVDCSGLVMMCLKSIGVVLPHNSHEQARYGKVISVMDSLKRGDLVFYIKSFKSKYLITHSGICIGDGKFIHTSASSGVVVSDLNMPYWKTKFIFGTRIKS